MSRHSEDPESIIRSWAERDLTQAAQLKQLKPAWEIDPVVQSLAELVRSGRRPVVVGDEGVGKTAAIEALVCRAQTEPGYEKIAGRPVLEISIRTRASALEKPEKLRPELQKLVSALEEVGDRVVPYFRDLHLIYTHDLEPQLELLAQRFPGTILCEADGAMFDALIEWQPQLERLFAKVPVFEPSLARTERMALAWAADAKKRGLHIEPNAVLHGLQLGHRFLGRARQPRKTFSLLDLVLGLHGTERPATVADVTDAFEKMYGVPRLLIDPSAPFDPIGTAKAFHARVLEQPEAVDAVIRMINTIKSGLSDARRPFGAFLFVGPTGVGKTHIAQLLAEHLFGSRDRLVRLNMADYPNPEDALVLFGNPDVSGIRQRRGVLATRLMGHPFAVILLDEFEKAHPKVHDRFLQLVDEGCFLNGASELISCRSSIVIATSNAGANVFHTNAIGFANELDTTALDREVDRQLARQFRHEFLNRFDQVVHFRPLSRYGVRAIALREIEQLLERPGVRTRELVVEVDESVLDWLAAHGYHPHFGARFLRRTMERSITSALAELLVRENLETGARVELAVRQGRVVARCIDSHAGHLVEERDRQGDELTEGNTGVRARVLNYETLRSDAYALVERSREPLAALAEQKTRAAEILAQMSDNALWNDRAEAQTVLEDYRELDVAVHVGTRVLAPAVKLAELLQHDNASTSQLARCVEEAARGLRHWTQRTTEDGPSAVWLMVRSADPLADMAGVIEQVVEMELQWCKSLHLSAAVVAFACQDDLLNRAFIQVEGPGAFSFLEMEEGIHRFYGQERNARRVRVDVIARKQNTRTTSVLATPVRGSHPHMLGVDGSVTLRCEHASSGQLFELFGADARTLEALEDDINGSNVLGRDSADLAREYGRDGTGARDPRTGETMVRVHDVLSGKLDKLFEAWLKRTHPDVSNNTGAHVQSGT